jgi:Virulence-associated protein and related proteins
MEKTAKLFKNGRSQAVRLPAEFRFEGEEVFIRKNEETGEVILSPKPVSWDTLVEYMDMHRDEIEELVLDRDTRPAEDRDIFHD